jgi:hypothetical protein
MKAENKIDTERRSPFKNESQQKRKKAQFHVQPFSLLHTFSMRCTLDKCEKKLLDEDYNTLSREDKQHVRHAHHRQTEIVVMHDMFFTFRRGIHRYPCFCEQTFATAPSIKTHVLGVDCKSVKRAGCSTFSDKAKELARTSQVCKDGNIAINYWPLKPASIIPPTDEEENSK